MSDRVPERSSQRASDADREAIVETLRAAAADGRLDLEEFEERMAASYGAKTFGELEPLVADLGGIDPSRTEESSATPRDEVVIQGVGSSVKRDGAWEVPRRVVISRQMGSAILDLTEAKVMSREVEFALDMSLGSLTIIVPPGTAVDASELVTNFGSVSVRVEQPANPTLRVRITGATHMTSVMVRRPGYFARRRLRRRAARELPPGSS